MVSFLGENQGSAQDVRVGLTTQPKIMLDVASAYPNGEDILNCSKETTVAEMIGIEGINYDKQRVTGINLTGGDINATEICQTVMGAPGFEQLLADFQQHEI